MNKRIDEIGSVGLQRILHKRKRTIGDPMSVGSVTTKHQANRGFRTEGERETVALKIKQDTQKGKRGGGASRVIRNRRLGLSEGKESTPYSKVYALIIAEARRSNPKLDYILGVDAKGEKKKSAPVAMSGATRTLRRGLRKAKSGKANPGEDLINDVPKKWGAMMRRGRRMRNKK